MGQVTTIIPTKSAKQWNDNAIQECFQLALKSFVSRDKQSVDNGDNITYLFNPGEIKYEEDTMDVDDNNNTMNIDIENGDDKNRWKPSELAPPLWALIHPGNQINNNKNEIEDNPKSMDDVDAT